VGLSLTMRGGGKKEQSADHHFPSVDELEKEGCYRWQVVSAVEEGEKTSFTPALFGINPSPRRAGGTGETLLTGLFATAQKRKKTLVTADDYHRSMTGRPLFRFGEKGGRGKEKKKQVHSAA